MFYFYRLAGEMIQFDLRIFFKWVSEKPPTRSLELSCFQNIAHIPKDPCLVDWPIFYMFMVTKDHVYMTCNMPI